MVKIGITVDPFDIKECVAVSALADKYGFDGVWVADETPAPPYRDCFVTMQAILANTKRVVVASCINPMYIRHPSVLAVWAKSLEELYPRRVALGLGPGGSLTLVPMGIPLWNRPIGTMKESVEIIRALFEGKTVNHKTDLFTVNGVKLYAKPSKKIPVYLAARGTQMLRLVGRVADGSIITMPDGFLKTAIKIIKDAAKKAGRKADEVDIGNTWPFAISKNPDEAIELVKPSCTYMLSDFPREGLREVGITPAKQDEMRETFRTKGKQAAIKLVDRKVVAALAVAGDPEYVIKNSLSQLKAGVTNIIYGAPFGKDPKKALTILAKEVIPAIREAD
jgi:5,10-methylenetetrahydromethanopterin reductase